MRIVKEGYNWSEAVLLEILSILVSFAITGIVIASLIGVIKRTKRRK